MLFAAWSRETPVLLPGHAGDFDSTAVKDPSIVYAEGKWHLFYTARGNGKYSLGYVAASTLRGLASARRVELSGLSAGSPTYAAPQVFYFRPKKEWFLVYQTAASNYQPMYSTTKTIGNPASWSPPRELVKKTGTAKWIDFWVICDERNAYLFFTQDHSDVVAMSTALANFPEGLSGAATVFRGVHEAVHIYREQGQSKYGMLFELREQDLSRRYALAEADQLLGPWRVREQTFARASHGELIRASFDEHLEADFTHPRFLVQSLPRGIDMQNYTELPWQLKLIE